MRREVNIFYKLVRDENSFTELFVNLFQFQIFRSFFEEYISKKCNTKLCSLKYEDISTQNRTDEYGIPDVRFFTDKAIILLENKVENYTHLTEHQPESYLEYLCSEEYINKIRILLFFVPKRYLYEAELLKRVAVYQNNCLHNIIFKVLYWEDLIHEFYKYGLCEINPIFDHFYHLTTNWFPTTKINFSKNELEMIVNSTLIETLSKLMEIVQYVSNQLEKKEGINRHLAFNQNEYAIYITDKENNDILYFGIWYPFWKAHNFPFAFAVDQLSYNSKYVDKFKVKFPNYIRDNSYAPEDWIVFGIDPQIFSTENCEEDVLLLVIKVIDYLIN
jgi:hypothetical protein